MRVAVTLLAALAVSGCAMFRKDEPPLDDFEQAFLMEEEELPVEIVSVSEPWPLPGQLVKLEDASMTTRREPASPADRIERANAEARIEPSLDGYLNAVQVYPYTTGALYQLYAAPQQVTDIALEPGEQLTDVSAGDTVRWVVGDTTSGSPDGEQVHILVKPVQPGLRTNLVITTDRRAYHLELTSFRETYMASISWRYPQDELRRRVERNGRAQARAEQVVDREVVLEQLRFRYTITGDRPSWRPVRAFDDGNKVYIEFPARIDQGQAPPLFVLGPDGQAQLVNYRMRGSYYVVDRLFAAAELRLGEDPQQIVRIARSDVDVPASRTRSAGRGGRGDGQDTGRATLTAIRGGRP